MISTVQNAASQSAAASAPIGAAGQPGQSPSVAALQILLAAATLAQNLSVATGKGVALNTSV